EALALLPAGPLHTELERVREETERHAGAGPDELALLDATAHRQRVGPLLERVSQVVRAAVGDRGPDRSGADLIGANLRGADLRGTSLRGTYLLGADLRGADLRRADLLGADLRAADLRAAKLDGSIFLTQPQLDTASGDAATTIPTSLTRPRHWPTTPAPTTAGDTDAAGSYSEGPTRRPASRSSRSDRSCCDDRQDPPNLQR
ncbi:MAG TPA: pentapeptide repeat-containing protein, partial [Frankiaceae bacterium]|nr:pentapeptide repeat-containing protein [Frankiaceae bacterium]